MGADISRVRFDPLRDFAGVVLQQGRLLLDADFNELVAMLDRRLRAETCDLTSFGPGPATTQGVAWVPRQTPDAFRVTASGGALDRRGADVRRRPARREPRARARTGSTRCLARATGTADTPYLPALLADARPAAPTGGTHLAYLDVWQREVTHLEDPALVEIAVGVDTTARWQTVWQVRCSRVARRPTCATTDDDDLAGWLDLDPALRRAAHDRHESRSSDDDDPCELPPEGGYRGLENQTYRVEIHEGGDPTARPPSSGRARTPPWRCPSSRWCRRPSCASPRSAVTTCSGSRPTTGSRSSTTTASSTATPGEMRKVTVDDAERTITFTGALPLDLQPADAEDAADTCASALGPVRVVRD